MPDIQITNKEALDGEEVIISIPSNYYVWSINPRGDSTFITLKEV